MPEGRLCCTREGAALFWCGGVFYALNGVGAATGGRDADPVWRDDPDIAEAKVTLMPWIRRALAMEPVDGLTGRV